MTDDASLPTRAERQQLLVRLEAWLERPMLVLGVIWLALLIIELTMELPTVLAHVATGIWMIFIADFAIRIALSNDRWGYLRHNWLTVISLLVPALRVFRVARFVRVLRASRAIRGVRATRLITTFGRARRSIHALLARRHAVGYVASLTVAATLLGAAGMLAFEREGAAAAGFDGYPHALWWTAMLLTTMGSDVWPVTTEGRALCLLLSIYGFAVFGYLTATIASWLVGKDRATLAPRPPETATATATAPAADTPA
ncbi:MAG: ion transporter [Myxococcota bacterium]|nr:ion transporter [Myxococcota bacterium]